jgi:hypothetical protein
LTTVLEQNPNAESFEWRLHARAFHQGVECFEVGRPCRIIEPALLSRASTRFEIPRIRGEQILHNVGASPGF